MDSRKLDRIHRNEYIRKMLTILTDKYFIERPKLARAMGYQNSYIADFLRGDRTYSTRTLDNIESFIFDLYEPILQDELELNKLYLQDLIARSHQAELEKTIQQNRKKNRRVTK